VFYVQVFSVCGSVQTAFYFVESGRYEIRNEFLVTCCNKTFEGHYVTTRGQSVAYKSKCRHCSGCSLAQTLKYHCVC